MVSTIGKNANVYIAKKCSISIVKYLDSEQSNFGCFIKQPGGGAIVVNSPYFCDSGVKATVVFKKELYED